MQVVCKMKSFKNRVTTRKGDGFDNEDEKRRRTIRLRMYVCKLVDGKHRSVSRGWGGARNKYIAQVLRVAIRRRQGDVSINKGIGARP